MKIFITGATGLIGAHTTLALLKAGHQVRLLVRNEAAAKHYFSKHGFELDDLVVTDMLDKEAVKESMKGCDAVAHIAAIVDLNAQNAKKTQSVNLASIDSVIGSACELGLSKILYVSSMSVFYDFSQGSLNEETPLANVKDAYSLSKKLCEERIREMQAQGHSIISTYPAGVFGPDDPKLAESNLAVVKFASSIMPVTSSGMQFVDARDVGEAHRLLLEKDSSDQTTKERYIIGGHFVPWKQLADQIEHAVGKKVNRINVPGFVFRALGSTVDFIRRFININYPISREAMDIVTLLPEASSAKLMKHTSMNFRSAETTIKDTVKWMQENGHLKI